MKRIIIDVGIDSLEIIVHSDDVYVTRNGVMINDTLLDIKATNVTIESVYEKINNLNKNNLDTPF